MMLFHSKLPLRPLVLAFFMLSSTGESQSKNESVNQSNGTSSNTTNKSMTTSSEVASLFIILSLT